VNLHLYIRPLRLPRPMRFFYQLYSSTTRVCTEPTAFERARRRPLWFVGLASFARFYLVDTHSLGLSAALRLVAHPHSIYRRSDTRRGLFTDTRWHCGKVHRSFGTVALARYVAAASMVEPTIAKPVVTLPMARTPQIAWTSPARLSTRRQPRCGLATPK
jgi:hypothetical protein